MEISLPADLMLVLGFTVFGFGVALPMIIFGLLDPSEWANFRSATGRAVGAMTTSMGWE